MPVYPIYQTPNDKGTYFADALRDYFLALGCENPFEGIYHSNSLPARKRDFDRIFKDVLSIFDDPDSGIDVYYKHGEYDLESGVTRYTFFEKANFCFYLSPKEFLVEIGRQGTRQFTVRAFAYYGPDAEVLLTNIFPGRLQVFFVVGAESDHRIVTGLGEGFTIIRVGALEISGGGALELEAGRLIELEADPTHKRIRIHCLATGVENAIARVAVGETVFTAQGEDELHLVPAGGIEVTLDPEQKKLQLAANPDRFARVRVGQETIVAQGGDVLELQAGNNISLQVNPDMKTVLISASGTVSDLVLEHESKILTQQDIVNGYVDLDYEPVYPSEVLLFINGGGSQQIGFDYEVNGRRVSWFQRQLADLLEVGDVLNLVYQRVA